MDELAAARPLAQRREAFLLGDSLARSCYRVCDLNFSLRYFLYQKHPWE